MAVRDQAWIAACAVGIALAGCRRIEPAPEDVDGLARWFWVEYDAASDEEIAEAIGNLADVVEADTLEEPFDGRLSDLAAEDLAPVGMQDTTDPTLAAGFFLVGPIACTVDQVEAVFSHLAQDELYEGVYDAYARSYTSDEAAYFARGATTLTWEVEITATIIGARYTEWLNGGIRRVPESAHGPILIGRTYMPRPAEFESGSKTFDQDYQLDVFWERAPGEIVHFYPVWRQIDLGAGLDQDSETVLRTTLNNFADWDEQTGVLCAEGRP